LGNNKLTARGATTSKPGRYGDGGGLYLVVSATGARKWVFRFTFAGKVTEAGLGSANVVSLADARDEAHQARKLIKAGENPIAVKRQAALKAADTPNFGVVADELISSKQREWRNEKHRAQWRASLTTFAAALRPLPIDEIDTAAILAVLKPLWLSKPETAARLRGRIEAVLDAGKAKGHRSGENPAAWRGHLAHLLPKRAILSRGHHSAMDYREVPKLIAKLRESGSVSAMALEFCILTAARSGEVYGLKWSEIDLSDKVWTLPPARMKAGRQHRVPLSGRAVEILQTLVEAKTSDYAFPSPRSRNALSHVAMAKVMGRLKIKDATVHGFRSAFRDWCGESTSFPREVAEAALAHTIGDKAEQAYRRGDALEKRRAMMESWAQWCEPKIV
jgi:integrase